MKLLPIAMFFILAVLCATQFIAPRTVPIYLDREQGIPIQVTNIEHTQSTVYQQLCRSQWHGLGMDDVCFMILGIVLLIVIIYLGIKTLESLSRIRARLRELHNDLLNKE